MMQYFFYSSDFLNFLEIPVKSYLCTLRANEIAELMLNSILSMCGQGQDLVPYYSFELEISDPIFETIHKKFVNKFVDNIDQVC